MMVISLRAVKLDWIKVWIDPECEHRGQSSHFNSKGDKRNKPELELVVTTGA
jgi:hypothetical protein